MRKRIRETYKGSLDYGTLTVIQGVCQERFSQRALRKPLTIPLVYVIIGTVIENKEREMTKEQTEDMMLMIEQLAGDVRALTTEVRDLTEELGLNATDIFLRARARARIEIKT